MRPQPVLLVCGSFRSARFYWSGRRDLNSRPLVPQTSALTGLRHAPTGTARTIGLSATVDLISVSARMSQPYCKRPKRAVSRSRFLPFRARSASMFSNRWASKTRSRWVGCSDGSHPARLQRPGRQQTDPDSFLNSACYRFADFIFAISVRALENEFLSGTDVSMSYNYR